MEVLSAIVFFCWTFYGTAVYMDMEDRILIWRCSEYGIAHTLRNRPSRFLKCFKSVMAGVAGPLMLIVAKRHLPDESEIPRKVNGKHSTMTSPQKQKTL